MKPRPIVFFTDSANFGGTEQMLLALLTGVDRQRWQPTLAYHSSPGITPLLDAARNLNVSLWPVPPMPDGYVGAGRVPAWAYDLRSRDVAVFHAHLTWPLSCKWALAGAILARVPAIVATEHLFVDVPYAWAVRFQQRMLAAGVGRYIAVSDEVAQRVRASFGFSPAKIAVIRNGIDPTLFGCPPDFALRRSLTGPADRPIVLIPARLDSQKGHRFVIEAAAHLPDAVFVLAGDGPERATLEGLVDERELRDRVLFLGQRRDIPNLLASCDLFVLPSLYEGLPISVLEAMAAGKPTIATAIGGTNELVVHEKTGLLVPPADPQALARAIRHLLDNKLLAQRLGANGYAYVRQHFNAKDMVQRITDVYDQLLRTARYAHV